MFTLLLSLGNVQENLWAFNTTGCEFTIYNVSVYLYLTGKIVGNGEKSSNFKTVLFLGSAVID